MTVTLTGRQTLIAVVAAVGLICAGVLAVNHYRGAALSAQRLGEASDLTAHQVIVAQQLTAAQLDASARRLTAVQAELDRVRKAAPGATVVQTVSATTAPVTLQGAGCLLAAGDGLRLSVDQVELRTQAKNYVLAGVARALKIDAAGVETELLAAPFTQETKLAVLGDDQRVLGWAVGPLGLISTRGSAAGLQVSPPPLELFGLRLELTVGAAVGSAGALLSGGILVRM
jgi:hypothetical protein